MRHWAKRLNDSLHQSGWSKAELARRSGISYDSLNKYLAARVDNPRGDSLPRLASALGLNIIWLRDGVGPKDSSKKSKDSLPGHETLTLLGGGGGNGGGIPSSPEEARLETVKNPHSGKDYLVRFSCPEFTSLCPVTGQPDFAHLVIDYVPAKVIVESKSLKLFLASYRNHAGFHEDCTLAIAERLIRAAKPKWLRIGGYWYPRGGIPIDVFHQTGAPPKNLWIPDQGVPPYRGRG